MPLYGYILIDDEKWRVSVRHRKARRLIKRRSKGEDGEYLEDVQAFLEQPENHWLVSHLRYGTAIHVPLELQKRPTPPAANGV